MKQKIYTQKSCYYTVQTFFLWTHATWYILQPKDVDTASKECVDVVLRRVSNKMRLGAADSNHNVKQPREAAVPSCSGGGKQGLRSVYRIKYADYIQEQKAA